MSDEDASREFTDIIHACLNTRATQINDMFHMLKHA